MILTSYSSVVSDLFSAYCGRINQKMPEGIYRNLPELHAMAGMKGM